MDPGSKVGEWRIESLLGGGGQGTTYVVRADAERIGCLKILSNDGSKERRQRFTREAVCYSTLDIDGVPRFLSSNSFGVPTSVARPLYLCIELIEGSSLDKLDIAGASKSEIIAAVARLTRIIHDLHRVGIVHRDIKPQNIIARGSRLSDLYLVDFGLAFSSVALDDYTTEFGQELGNRFLRLPELQAGSRTKQDPISDITFAVGVLFYLITGVVPRSLVDGQGRMPHQRDELAGNRLLVDPEFKSFLKVFDKGFQIRLEERFRSAQELQEFLTDRAITPMPEYQTLEQIIAEINEPSARAKQQRIKHRDLFIETAHILARRMEDSFNGVYVFSQTGHSVSEDAIQTQVGFAFGQDYQISERVPFEAKVIGSQIVASAWGEEILRADADTPDWGATLAPAIQKALHRALIKLRERIATAKAE